jgi:hypothetical protein
MADYGANMDDMFADMGLGNVDDSQTYPYQEALLYDEYKKVDKLAAKLEETLGKKFRIVVKDSTPREDPDDYEDEDDPRFVSMASVPLFWRKPRHTKSPLIFSVYTVFLQGRFRFDRDTRNTG